MSETEQRVLDQLRQQAQARNPQLSNNERGATISATDQNDVPLVLDLKIVRGN